MHFIVDRKAEQLSHLRAKEEREILDISFQQQNEEIHPKGKWTDKNWNFEVKEAKKYESVYQEYDEKNWEIHNKKIHSICYEHLTFILSFAKGFRTIIQLSV